MKKVKKFNTNELFFHKKSWNNFIPWFNGTAENLLDAIFLALITS